MPDIHTTLQDDLKTLLSPANVIQLAFIVVILIGLYLISTVNYLLFHGIIEVAGIAVAFSIFIIIWNTRRVITDGFFLIIGISFLFFGSIDLVHTLAYKGMGIFPGNSSDLPTQLWIAARYFQSITFLIATYFIGRSITRDRKYDVAIIITACTAACALLLASIFVWHNFPHCFIEGSGLTPFKIVSEYIISLILIATIVILFLKREHFDPTVWKLLIAAQAFLILGELAFTSYISVFGFMNMLGHLFRLLSVYLFYRAFVVISLTRPYDLILRELKLNEESLRESETKYRTLFENMLEGFAYCRMIYDDKGEPADWVYLDVNAAFERLTGLKNIAGKRVLEAIPDIRKLTPGLFDTYGRVASTGTPETFEIDFSPLNKWLKVSVFSPEKGFFVAVFEDVTEHKRIVAEVRKARDFYLKILDDFPNPIWRADIHAKCDYFNKDWLEFTGRTLEQELGDGWVEGVFKDDFDRCLKTYLDNFNARTPFEMEYRLRYHDGTYHWLNDSGKPFYTNGEFAGYIGSCYDIQDRKQAEEALKQANRKLNLLSSITRHDINNQLFLLKAFLELSKESLGDAAKTSEYIIKEERAANAIERQIIFTKEYQDLGVKAPDWQNVEAGVKNAYASLPMRDIRLTPEVNNLEVYADPLLEKVFYNLIDNALRYGGQKMTTIHISLKDAETGLVISVEDDGVGILAEDKKRLFERGFGKHTGLGLFLSREILSITGITITETGEPGKGARFEILVPKGGYRFLA
ncbi:MAG: MASE3 domain-containing protein [Methanoregula sp.]